MLFSFSDILHTHTHTRARAFVNIWSFKVGTVVFLNLTSVNWSWLRSRKGNSTFQQNIAHISQMERWCRYVTSKMVLLYCTYDKRIYVTCFLNRCRFLSQPSHTVERKWAGVICWGQTDTGNSLILPADHLPPPSRLKLFMYCSRVLRCE